MEAAQKSLSKESETIFYDLQPLILHDLGDVGFIELNMGLNILLQQPTQRSGVYLLNLVCPFGLIINYVHEFIYHYEVLTTKGVIEVSPST